MVGDTMSQDCWKQRHTEITGTHMIPYKLLNIVKWVVEAYKIQHSDGKLDKGRTMYGIVEQAAAQRGNDGSPY